MKRKENKNKKGISLIVLIITIAIIIILASAVILSIANNRPIESAKEATASHNDAVLKESAAVLSAQWEVDRLVDSSIGTRSEYVMQGLLTQGFTEEERGRVTVGDNGEITVTIDIASNYNKYLEEAKALGQSSSNDVGIGTDGNVVNLDLWSYEIQSNSIIIGSTMSCSYNPGAYKGKIINGKIVKYI